MNVRTAFKPILLAMDHRLLEPPLLRELLRLHCPRWLAERSDLPLE